jgi:pyridoxal/pyridoxine/pyridoxamine kinase
MLGYEGMLTDLGIEQGQMDVIVDSLNVIDVKTSEYYKGNSDIHGEGIFALKNINEGDIIGLGSIDNTNKTFLGRYTNHSDDRNAMFYYLLNGDVVMVAKAGINKDEEILVNYREHTLQKRIYNEKFI